MKNMRLQLIEVVIPNANAKVSIDTNTDKSFERIHGIFANPYNYENYSPGILMDLRIDNEEVLPKNFDIQLISASLYVSYKEAMFEFDVKGGFSPVTGSITDKGLAASYPYTIQLYLASFKK